MMKALKKMAETRPHLAEVRGRGLMIGLEFSDKDGNPSAEWAKKVVDKCFEKNMIVLGCGQQGQVVRLIPPLTISDKEADEALEILEYAMTE